MTAGALYGLRASLREILYNGGQQRTAVAMTSLWGAVEG